MRGRLITFEGGEGAGKSTQVALLAGQLRRRGLEVIVTREPGGTPLAERIRDLLLRRGPESGSALAEALLFNAARADHLAAVIRPALARGAWVVSDRFMDSTRAYQGAAGGLPPAEIDQLERLVVGLTRPDLTVLLDIDPAAGLTRAGRRRAASAEIGTGGDTVDAFEARALAFHTALRAAYAAIAAAEPARCVTIDAALVVEAIAAAVWQAVTRRLLGGP